MSKKHGFRTRIFVAAVAAMAIAGAATAPPAYCPGKNNILTLPETMFGTA